MRLPEADQRASRVALAIGHGLGRAFVGRDLGVVGAQLLQAQEALSGRGSTYLLDAGVTTARGGFRVWGTPHQPRFWGAFNEKRGAQIAAKWALIPSDTDVLLVHGPPAGHGDFVARKREHAGCEDLLQEARAACCASARAVACGCALTRATQVRMRVQPAAVVCGHIHEDAGVTWDTRIATAFINAAVCDLEARSAACAGARMPAADSMRVHATTRQHNPTQPPVVFTLRRSSDGAVEMQVAGHPRPAPPAALGWREQELRSDDSDG